MRVVDIPNVPLSFAENHVTNTKTCNSFKLFRVCCCCQNTTIETLVGFDRVEKYLEEKKQMLFKDYQKRWQALDEKAKVTNLSIPKKETLDKSYDDIESALNQLLSFGKTLEKEVKK